MDLRLSSRFVSDNFTLYLYALEERERHISDWGRIVVSKCLLLFTVYCILVAIAIQLTDAGPDYVALSRPWAACPRLAAPMPSTAAESLVSRSVSQPTRSAAVRPAA